jgi:hypothetical protein
VLERWTQAVSPLHARFRGFRGGQQAGVDPDVIHSGRPEHVTHGVHVQPDPGLAGPITDSSDPSQVKASPTCWTAAGLCGQDVPGFAVPSDDGHQLCRLGWPAQRAHRVTGAVQGWPRVVAHPAIDGHEGAQAGEVLDADHPVQRDHRPG